MQPLNTSARLIALALAAAVAVAGCSFSQRVEGGQGPKPVPADAAVAEGGTVAVQGDLVGAGRLAPGRWLSVGITDDLVCVLVEEPFSAHEECSRATAVDGDTRWSVSDDPRHAVGVLNVGERIESVESTSATANGVGEFGEFVYFAGASPETIRVTTDRGQQSYEVPAALQAVRNQQLTIVVLAESR